MDCNRVFRANYMTEKVTARFRLRVHHCRSIMVSLELHIVSEKLVLLIYCTSLLLLAPQAIY